MIFCLFVIEGLFSLMEELNAIGAEAENFEVKFNSLQRHHAHADHKIDETWYRH